MVVLADVLSASVESAPLKLKIDRCLQHAALSSIQALLIAGQVDLAVNRC